MNLPPDRPLSKAAEFNAKHWTWFLSIFGVEYWLSFSIPPDIQTDYPVLKTFVDVIGTIAPVVHNFDKVAPSPQALSLFFAVTTLLIVPKTVFFFIWLNSSRIAMYRHLVISPLTSTSPKRPGDFVTEPLHEQTARDEKPRSLVNRVFWSLLIVLISCSIVYVNMVSGWEVTKRPVNAIPKELLEVASGGASLWLYWSLKWTTLTALLLAITFCIVRDYVSFFRYLGRARGPTHE